jgi:hypothetical protein
MKTKHVMQFSEKAVPLCFEDHVNTTCGQGQGIATSEAML